MSQKWQGYTYTRGFPDGSVGKESAYNAWNEESEKVCLKLNIQKTKIMASGPTTSCEIDGETVETVSDFIYLFIFWLHNLCRW